MNICTDYTSITTQAIGVTGVTGVTGVQGVQGVAMTDEDKYPRDESVRRVRIENEKDTPQYRGRRYGSGKSYGSTKGYRGGKSYGSGSRTHRTDIPPVNPEIETTPRAATLTIHEKAWYFNLVDKKVEGEKRRARALLRDYAPTIGQLVICMQVSNDELSTLLGYKGKTNGHGDGDSDRRLFALFDSYLEFFSYQKLFPVPQRHFYEVIMGSSPQKPHFDVDISVAELERLYPESNIDQVASELVESLIGAILELYPSICIEKDLLLFSSHGPQKRSFHIVVANHCHADNKDAGAFYRKVVERIPRYNEFVDEAVYSSRQQFRIVGSNKAGSGRPKIFHPDFVFRGNVVHHILHDKARNDEHYDLLLLLESLVSSTTMCRFMPSFMEAAQPRYYESVGDLTTDRIQKAFRMVLDSCGSGFDIREVKGTMIMLNRTRPSMCKICNKQHDADNPYVIVSQNKVRWYCRRARNKFLELGTLDGTSTSDGTVVENNSDNDDGDSDEEGIISYGSSTVSVAELKKSKALLNSHNDGESIQQPQDMVADSFTTAPLVNNITDRLTRLSKETEKVKIQKMQQIKAKKSQGVFVSVNRDYMPW